MTDLLANRRPTAMTAVALSVWLVGASAWAQPAAPSEADQITRRQLLQQAAEAQSAGHNQEALTLAQRAEQIAATAGTRLMIAQIRAQLGQYVEALSSLELCLREVDLDRLTSARNRAAIREQCEALQGQVRTHIGSVVIEVPAGAPATLRVTVGGQELHAALYGAPRSVTAGEVTVVTSVPGAEARTQRVTVAAGATERVRVEVPHAVAPQVSAAPVRGVTQPPRESPSFWSTRRTLGVVAGGVGLVMIGGGAIAGAMFEGTSSDYTAARCPEVALNASCQDQYDRMGALNTVQWIGYLGGGALLATGVVLFLTAPSGAPRETALRCGVGPGTVGLACGARF